MERETCLRKGFGRLHKSNGGNWGAEKLITKGGKWRFCINCGTLEAAETAAEIHREKGRKVKIVEKETGKTNAKKKGIPLGQKYWQVFAYIARRQIVISMLTNAECIEAGVEPGPANI